MIETVLFIDDEEHLRIAAEQTFELADIACKSFGDAEIALADLNREFAGAIVTDIRMPGTDGVAMLQRVMEIDPDLPVILVTGHGDVDLAVSCIKDGAYDFLEKPCEPARLVATVRRAMERRRLTLENRALREQVTSTNVIEARLPGRSDVMATLRDRVSAIAATDADILISGPTGTGKEVTARAIHLASERSDRPFVHINCAALPAALIESELFGSEAGAFPGSVRARVGRLEHARKGVLCLDEIDSLPLPLQAKLLDVLDKRQITRLGSNDPIPLDVRVIAISKMDLEQAVREGTFRSDLLYRLNILTIQMPSIAQRREDVPGLFSTLVGQAAQRHNTIAPEISNKLLGELTARDWPGNVREIRNEAERFVLGMASGQSQKEAETSTLADQLASHEKALIAAAISANGGRLKETYEALGLSRKSLYDKMQRYGLRRDDFAND